MLFMPTTPLTTVDNFIPIAFPLLAPCKRQAAGWAYFSRQLRWFACLCHTYFFPQIYTGILLEQSLLPSYRKIRKVYASQ